MEITDTNITIGDSDHSVSIVTNQDVLDVRVVYDQASFTIPLTKEQGQDLLKNLKRLVYRVDGEE